jgi:hypothetical protein
MHPYGRKDPRFIGEKVDAILSPDAKRFGLPALILESPENYTPRSKFTFVFLDKKPFGFHESLPPEKDYGNRTLAVRDAENWSYTYSHLEEFPFDPLHYEVPSFYYRDRAEAMEYAKAWIAEYEKYHDNIEIYYQSDNVIIYLIEK